MPLEDVKNYTLAQIKDSNTVWFGCDVGKHLFRAEGVLDTRIFDYELVGVFCSGQEHIRLHIVAGIRHNAGYEQGAAARLHGKPNDACDGVHWC